MATGIRRRLDIGHVFSGKGICCNRIHNICNAQHKQRTCFCFTIQSRMSSVVRYSCPVYPRQQTLRCHILSIIIPATLIDSQLWMSPRNNTQSHQECCKYVARRSLESNHKKPGGRTNSTYSTPDRRRRKSQCTHHISGNDFQHRPGYLAGCSSR